jgi:hypothetical protein
MNNYENEEYRTKLARNEAVVLDELLTPQECLSWSSHFDSLLTAKRFGRDLHLPGRRAIYNEARACNFHPRLAPPVSFLVGKPVKPSYTFSVIYKPGCELTRHTDRPQCEWNISLLIDARPRSLTWDWPLYLETSTGVRTITLGPGSGVLFSGTRTPHWRDPMPGGCSARLVLFHFVDELFVGSTD